MGLPILKHPTFSLVLPSSQQTVVFRPFLVKEEKILLIAQAGGDQADIVRAIQQVISNCVVTEGVDVENFTTFDLEYFFIKLRSKSVQNVIELQYKDNEDQKIYTVEVDLDQVEVVKDKEANSKVVITSSSGLNLRYPRLSIMDDVKDLDNAVDFNFAIMQACIETIYDGDTVYNPSDFSSDELKEYIDSLDVKTYQNIQLFIEAMPRVEHVVQYTNSNGKEVKITLKTLTDFFTLG
jgi:hypothetical protein